MKHRDIRARAEGTLAAAVAIIVLALILGAVLVTSVYALARVPQ